MRGCCHHRPFGRPGVRLQSYFPLPPPPPPNSPAPALSSAGVFCAFSRYPLSIPVCRSPPPDPPLAWLILPKHTRIIHTHLYVQMHIYTHPYTYYGHKHEANYRREAPAQPRWRRRNLQGRAGQAARTLPAGPPGPSPLLTPRPRVSTPRGGGGLSLCFTAPPNKLSNCC